MRGFQTAACLHSLRAKLVFMIAISLSAWLLGALAQIKILALLSDWSFRTIGITFACLLLCAGLAISAWKYVPAPKGSNVVGWSMHVIRGTLASTVAFIAIWLSTVNPTIAGAMAVPNAFPCIRIHRDA